MVCYSSTGEQNIVGRIASFALAVLLGMAKIYAAGGTPSLSGTWKMDPSRSESAHQAVPIGTIVLVVKQTPAMITIVTRRTLAGTSEVQSESLNYLLNGTEISTEDGAKKPIKTKARWQGSHLITETERTVNGASVTTRCVHSLDENRREMKLEKTLTVQHGYQFEGAKSYGTGVDIFVKSAQ